MISIQIGGGGGRSIGLIILDFKNSWGNAFFQMTKLVFVVCTTYLVIKENHFQKDTSHA